MYTIKPVDPSNLTINLKHNNATVSRKERLANSYRTKRFYIYSKNTFTSTSYKDIPNLVSKQNLSEVFTKLDIIYDSETINELTRKAYLIKTISFKAKNYFTNQAIFLQHNLQQGMVWNGMENGMEWNGNFGMEYGRFQEWNERQSSILPYQFHTKFRALHLQKNTYRCRVVTIILSQKYSTAISTHIIFRQIAVLWLCTLRKQCTHCIIVSTLQFNCSIDVTVDNLDRFDLWFVFF